MASSTVFSIAITLALMVIVLARKRRKLISGCNDNMKMSKAFKDKTVWITGASSGIGRSLAIAFHGCGANVILSARSIDKLNSVAEECMHLHPDVMAPVILPLDLTAGDTELIRIANIAMSSFKHQCIDILINNGGISSRLSFLDTLVSVDRHVMEVNFFGAVTLCKAVIPAMVSAGNGHVVVVSSVQGKLGIPNRSSYAASKHALHGYCDSLRHELHNTGVGITLVCPGYVRTDLSLNAITGHGEKHNTIDPTTAKGTDPDVIAHRIMIAVMERRDEVWLADIQTKLAIYLGFLAPWFLGPILRKREHSMKQLRDATSNAL